MLIENGDKHIAFSDSASSFDGSKEVVRLLVVTDIAIWLLDKTKDSVAFFRRIPFRDIESLSLSRLSSDLLVIHNSKEHDLLLRTAKRAEFMFWLMRKYKDAMTVELHWKFGER